MFQQHSRLPSYRLHKPSGQAVVTLNGRDFYLGPHGTASSREAYDRLIAEWLASKRSTTSIVVTEISVAEILAAYLRFAQNYYVKDGSLTSEITCMKAAMRPLHRLYGSSPAARFGPLALKAVREAMIQHGYARRTINHHISRIRRIFRWATENELIPSSVLEGLKSVAGLSQGRTDARETEPVGPVDDEVVTATLPHLSKVVRAMVQVQRLTGARPGEVCLLRPANIDRSGSVWCYTPATHKTEHRGRQRRIFIGPQAQAELLPFLVRAADAYCFCPRESARAEAEGMPRPPTRRRRAGHPRPSRRGLRYTRDSYRRAISRACDRAGVAHWSPNQLRHAAATEIRKEFGLEAAQNVLGHSLADVTQIYAERDFEVARRVMEKVG